MLTLLEEENGLLLGKLESHHQSSYGTPKIAQLNAELILIQVQELLERVLFHQTVDTSLWLISITIITFFALIPAMEKNFLSRKEE